jgi:signal transduction histidine kinase
VSSLQSRLFLTYVVIIVFTLCLVALTVYLQVGGYRDRLSYRGLEDIGRLVDLEANLAAQQAAATGEPEPGRALLMDLREAIASNREGESDPDTVIAVVDSEGRVISGGSAGPAWLASAVLEDVPATVSGAQADVRVPTRCKLDAAGGPVLLCVSMPLTDRVREMFPGSDARHLVVAEPAASLNDVFGDLTQRLVFAGVIGVGAAMILGLWFARTVASPLHNIARAARSVARGSYQQRVPATGPREVRELAATFNKMTEEVQHSQQTLRDFLANISHELKTPLTSIRGFSEAIQDGTIDDSQGIERSAKVISTESTRVLRLVEELLDLSRIESGQIHMRQENLDLEELFGHVQEIFALRAEESGVRLEIATHGNTQIVGDFERLEQVFNNLLDNAFRHTPRDGVVRIASRSLQPGTVQVTVSDTGQGIPPEHVPHLFERFYRSHAPESSNGRGKGYGLGLAITREIVRAHGGEIWATSEPGRGTTFVFTLPSVRPARSARSRAGR